jgi:hypothetical protein
VAPPPASLPLPNDSPHQNPWMPGVLREHWWGEGGVRSPGSAENQLETEREWQRIFSEDPENRGEGSGASSGVLSVGEAGGLRRSHEG